MKTGETDQVMTLENGRNDFISKHLLLILLWLNYEIIGIKHTGELTSTRKDCADSSENIIEIAI